MGVTNTFKTSVFVVVLCNSFQFGYNIAVCNSAQKNFFEIYDKSEYEKGFWSDWVVATFAIGALIGSLLSGPMTNKFGVRNIFYPISVISLLSAIFIYIASTLQPKPADDAEQAQWLMTLAAKQNKTAMNGTESNNYPYNHGHLEHSYPMALYMLAIGRILVGIFSGLASAAAPRYIMEISPKDKRGMIGVLNQLFITIGIMFAQIFGLDALFADSWMLCFTLNSVCSVVMLVLLIIPGIVAHSPRDQYIRTKDQDLANRTLMTLRSDEKDVHTEMEELNQEIRSAGGSSNELSIGEFFTTKGIRWQMVSLLVMHMCQQFSGINAVFFYTGPILESTGMASNLIQYYTFGLGALNVFMTIVSTAIIEKTGRKVLLTVGFSIMVVFDLLLVFQLPSSDSNGVPIKSNYEGGVIPQSVALICYSFIAAFIVGFAVGPGPVPWMYNTELFEQNSRTAASMSGCCVNWFCCALVGAFFPRIQHAIGQYVFTIFAGIGVLAVAWCIKFIPETKNQTFSNIYNAFANLNGTDKREEGENIPLKLRE